MQDWICSFCIQSTLTFYKVRDLHTLDSSIRNKYVIMEYQNKYLDIYNKHHCYTSVAHPNIQSLPSWFCEFSYTIIKYKFDIVALSKTWIKILKLDYAQIGSYISEFKNRESKCQDGVSFYKFMNQLRLSELRFKVEIRTRQFL